MKEFPISGPFFLQTMPFLMHLNICWFAYADQTSVSREDTFESDDSVTVSYGSLGGTFKTINIIRLAV